MSPVKTAEKPSEPLCAQDLRPLHLDLLRSWGDLDDESKRKKADAFRRQAAAAGKWIKSLEERDTVQAMIDYWTVTMANVPGGEAYPETVLLAEFSEKTVQKTKRQCPFVGLNAFQVSDAPHYFGREADVAAVLAALETNAAAIIVGPSGTGKTSLAQAGVSGTLLSKGGEWALLGNLVPGRDPVGALLRAVQPPNSDRKWFDEQRAAVTAAPEKFRELAEALRSAPEQRLLLFVDRAEELLASEGESSEIAVVAKAIAAFIGNPAAPGPHRLLFTIREDFLEGLQKLLTSAGLNIDDAAIHRLIAPTREGLRDAIVKPAELESFKFDDQVVEDLVNETAPQADALPLLEFALTHLWDAAEVDRVSWADYQQLPKPPQMIADVGDRIYAGFDSEAKEVARLTFMEMVRLGEETTFRRVQRDDLEKCIDEQTLNKRSLGPVLDSFVAGGLLRRIPGDSRPDDRFELAHSAVLRHWSQLHRWIDEKRSADSGRLRYTAALERWRANDRSWRYVLPLSWVIRSGKYREKSRALDEYLSVSRRWWMTVAVGVGSLVLLTLALLALQSTFLIKQGADIARVKGDEELATAQARDWGFAAADLASRAIIADQTLVRLLQDGRLTEDDLPPLFLDRLKERPDLPVRSTTYDRNFLNSDEAAAVPVSPDYVGRCRAVRCKVLRYPHTTVIYDPQLRIPLLVASNVDLGGNRLRSFRGIGFFLDPRLPASEQTTDPRMSAQKYGIVSPDRNYGLVPLVDSRQVGWVPSGSYATNSSFVNFAPFSVLQPWPFYERVWSRFDRRVFPQNVQRLTILTGPVLDGSRRRSDGILVPRKYWKLIMNWDELAGELRATAYVVDVETANRLEAVRDRSGRTRPLASAYATAEIAEVEKLAKIAFHLPLQKGPTPQAATVYLQFAGMPREAAVQLSRSLADQGYHLPPEESLESALGLAEVRHVRKDDAENATTLARATEALLKQSGYGDVSVNVVYLKWAEGRRDVTTPPGTLELWLGIPQVPRTKADTTYEVYDASDGYLSLRLLPNSDSVELVRMPVGAKVNCASTADNQPGWRSCVFPRKGLLLNGFAFDRYLRAPLPGGIAGPRPPSGAGATAFVVYGASDGFLALRSLPSVEAGARLAKMDVGKRVECGSPLADHPGWRPCSYNGLKGFAFDQYLKPVG